MGQQEIRSLLDNVYGSRLENDSTKCQSYFSPGATLQVAGLDLDESKSCSETICELVELWSFDKIENFETLIVGNKAATRYRLHGTFNPNGQKLQVDVADWITIGSDGLVEELVQHMDIIPLLKASGQL